MKTLITVLTIALLLTGCDSQTSASKKQSESTNRQQEQYGIAQPVPVYDWSLERDLVIQLYNIRNLKAITHSVWRSDRGLVEGDCASIGFGIPYDTSLTNPLVATGSLRYALTAIEQPEPNGIYASKNTQATWIMCAGDVGTIEPVYVETKVTVYPYAVSVDYDTNRVAKIGKATVTIQN